ncbi:MAG: hydroxymethylbilane synthase [Bacteroidota bacterium]
MHIKIGTRKSKLALWQANHIADLLQAAGNTTQLVLIDTTGDKMQLVSIPKIGSKGVFTKELEEALLNGSIDIAVHSAKDMPSELPEGLELIAFTKREFIRDVIISHNPDFRLEAGKGSPLIGSSSTRRRAMLSRWYPNARTVEARGNLQTRIDKMEHGICEALLLAEAGVRRMQYDSMIVQVLPETLFTPAAGQGSIAIETAGDLNPGIKDAVRVACNYEEAELCLAAERAFLHTMQGGCSVPVFCLVKPEGKMLKFHGGIFSLDGKKLAEYTDLITANNSSHAENLETAINAGKNAGQSILDSGGVDILAAIKKDLGR